MEEYRKWMADCNDLLSQLNGSKTKDYPHITWGLWFQNNFEAITVVEFVLGLNKDATRRQEESQVNN